MRLVIIGGDAAGMSAGSQARRLSPESEIIVLEATQDVSYGACGLPYKIPAGQNMEDLQVISAETFRTRRNLDVRLGHRVTRLLPAERKVRGVCPEGPFELTYDALLLATGARASRPPIAGLEALWGELAFPLKTLEHGRALKSALEGEREVRSAVVIGAGYIGLETTENLHARGMSVTVLEALPTLLPFLPESQRARVAEAAAHHGVTLKLGTLVKEMARTAGGRVKVTTSDGELVADLAIVATGVRPAAELAADAGLELAAAGAVKVNEQLLTSDPHIYAAGDCADAVHGVSGRSVWYPLALRANRAGKLAGANMTGAHLTAPPIMGTAVFKFFDLEVARTGLSRQEAEEAGFTVAEAEILGSTRAHYYPGGGKVSVWLLGDKKTGKLLGGSMVGPEAAAHKIDTVAACLHAGLTADQLYDMDLAYAPPFGPSWSPLLIAASKLMKALKKKSAPGL